MNNATYLLIEISLIMIHRAESGYMVSPWESFMIRMFQSTVAIYVGTYGTKNSLLHCCVVCTMLTFDDKAFAHQF